MLSGRTMQGDILLTLNVKPHAGIMIRQHYSIQMHLHWTLQEDVIIDK